MIKFSTMVSPDFQESFNKLVVATLPGKSMLRIKRMTKKIQEEMKHYEDARKQICEDAAKKGEDGKAIIVEQRYDIPDDVLPTVTQAISDLANESVDLGEKLPFAWVESAQLTTKDLLVLEELIDDPTE